MQKTLLSSGLILMLVLVYLPCRSVVTAGGFDWSTIALDESASTTEVNDNSTDSANASPKKKGNGFVRVLSAPFRAFGRLFGGGGKKNNDPQTARRSSDKDARKFEGTTVTRIKDARTPKTTDAAAANTTAGPATLDATAFADHFGKGQQLLNSGDLDGAIAELSRAASLDTANAEVQNLMGVAYESKGLRQRALQSFAAAVRADKNNAQYLNNYGFLLYRSGDADEATKYLKRAAKLSPNDARIWNNLGLAQCGRGKFDDAFESFARAVGEFNGHLNVATQLQRHGYAKEAIKHLQKAQAINPNSADVITKLVALYEMTGRPTDAEAARRSLVALKTFADANK